MPDARHILRRLNARRRELQHARQDAALQPTIVAGASRTLVLSPHLDDAVLDCWSVLGGEESVTVANVFAGVPQDGARVPLWDRITGATDAAARVRERLAEDRAALARAGREPLSLPLLDAQYRGSGRPLGPADIDRELSARLPGTFARVLAPAAIGGHPDHLLVRRYARALLRCGLAVTLYADLPYCVLHGWPGWVDGRAAEPFRDVDAFWQSFLAGVPELPPLRSARVARLDDERAAAKLEALRCYRTQLPALGYGARGLIEDPEIHRYEVFWDLDPGARAAG
jgi:LmbE family N-acetylglucosaminyl deacetylase